VVAELDQGKAFQEGVGQFLPGAGAAGAAEPIPLLDAGDAQVS
jgi:hypothetical protein